MEQWKADFDVLSCYSQPNLDIPMISMEVLSVEQKQCSHSSASILVAGWVFEGLLQTLSYAWIPSFKILSIHKAM